MHDMPRTCFPSRTRQPVRIPAIERRFLLTRSDTMARRSFQSGFPDAAPPGALHGVIGHDFLGCRSPASPDVHLGSEMHRRPVNFVPERPSAATHGDPEVQANQRNNVPSGVVADLGFEFLQGRHEKMHRIVALPAETKEVAGDVGQRANAGQISEAGLVVGAFGG